MSNKRIRWIIALAALVCLAAWFYRSHAPGREWNVLLITLDTTRPDRLGCYGYAAARTPAIDGLAREGVLFERAWCTVPLTLPSHASIMTGLLPPGHGLRVNAYGRLSKGIPTLAELLARRGWSTAAFVASPVLAAKFGLDRGFGVYDDKMPPGTVGEDLEKSSYRRGDLVADSAVEWLKANGGDRFFCWVHLYDPHAPYHAHEDLFGDAYTNSPYDAEIAFADIQVGRILKCLRETGAGKKTIIAVIGDHGESLGGPHAEPSPHHGFMLYDQTMRIPLVISTPGGRRDGTRIASGVSSVDLFSTILDLLGVPAPGNSGRSLAAALDGGEIGGVPLYGETEQPVFFGCSPVKCLVSGDWKYIRHPGAELYCPGDDPGETNNRAALEPGVAADCDLKLAAIEKKSLPAAAERVTLSDAEKKKLESLGYVAFGSAPVAPAGGDVKSIHEMIPVLEERDRAEKLMLEWKTAEAVELWRRVVDAAPSVLTFRNSLGCALLGSGQAADALAEFEKLQREMEGKSQTNEPMYRAVLNNRAYALGILKRYDEALPMALESVAADVFNGKFNHTLAFIYRGMGQYESAFRYAELAAELSPSDPEARLLFAEILLAMGRRDKALVEAGRILELPVGMQWKEAAGKLVRQAKAAEERGRGE